MFLGAFQCPSKSSSDNGGKLNPVLAANLDTGGLSSEINSVDEIELRL